jgi:hypothetical protein
MIAIPCQKDKENVEKRISSCCCVLLRVKFRRLTNIILTPSDRQMALPRRNCRVIFFFQLYIIYVRHHLKWCTIVWEVDSPSLKMHTSLSGHAADADWMYHFMTLFIQQ